MQGNEYTEQVNFTATRRYGCGPNDEDDVYTVAEFRQFCKQGHFIDYDGFGHPVRERKANPSVTVKPSRIDEIPADATHVVWYNR
jgi:hypothetical protein